jgi:hypothetical protein
MGAAGGALGAIATGGNPAMGAISGGLTAGIMAGMGFSPMASVQDVFTQQALKQLVISTAVGAMVGGVTAEMFGGDFGQGAAYGAASSAAGFVVATTLKQFLEPVADFIAQKAAFAVDIAINVAVKVWNSPNTAIGLVYGFAGVLLGGDWPVLATDGIHFPNSPLQPADTAVAFGNVAVYGKGKMIDPSTGKPIDT